MANRKKEVYKPKPMTEGKKNLIQGLLQEYDILILCADGLIGIKDAISAAFPKTEQPRCIVHVVRNTVQTRL